VLVSGYDVEILNEKTMNEFIVKNFTGPKDSPYEGVSYFLSSYIFIGHLESKSFFM
jgi:hypothetical protein